MVFIMKKIAKIFRLFLCCLLNLALLITTTSCKSEKTTTSLDGKKVIFIGNSFIYYGNAVCEKKWKVLSQEERSNDEGYFYQLCKANGENVAVTNFTFGGHALSDFTSHNCKPDRDCKGTDHFSYLTDREFDYVVIGPGIGDSSAETFLQDVKYIMEMFKKANPKVKFLCLVNTRFYETAETRAASQEILNKLKSVEEMGVKIVDWGKIANDLITGETEIKGSVFEYNKNSFIVSKSAKDGFHPNQLSGYITSLMTYCAITGKSAVGMPYNFVGDASFSTDPAYRSFAEYVTKYYTYDTSTDYCRILQSESDMTELQKLIDLYLEEKSYRTYNY